jgi:gas vesicle protein
MCDSSQNKAAGAVGFTAGILLGAGAGFLLSTKKGRKIVKETWQKVEPYVSDMRDTIDDATEKGRDVVQDVVSDVKPKVNKFKKTFFKGL